MESARLIADSRPVVVSALLRETALPIPVGTPIRLPVAAWEVLTHLRWGFQIFRKKDVSESELQRADDALAWLVRQANEGAVTVITHGVFRRILANRALMLGWQEITQRRSFRYWSCWSFTKEH